MKRISTACTLAICLLLTTGLMAQEAQKKMHIKIEKEVNGQKTLIDTVLTVNDEADAQVILKNMGIDMEGDNEDIQSINVFKLKEGDLSGIEDEATRAKVQQALEEAGIDPASLDHKEGNDHNMIIIKHTEEHADGEKGEHVWVNVDATEHNLDGKEVKIMIKHGEGEGVEENVWINQDGDVHHIEGEDGKHMMIIKSDGEDLTEAQKAMMKEAMEKGEGVMKEVTVDLMLDENGDKKVVKSIRIIKLQAEIKDLDDADLQTLHKAGADASNLRTLAVEDLSFFPNPNDGRFTLRFTALEDGPAAVRIFDATGRTVYEEKPGTFAGTYENQIDISAESKGVYFLTITQNDKTLNKKIVLE